MHKTTLYFLVQLSAIDSEQRDTSDREGRSEIVWLSIEQALPILQMQAKRLSDWPDLDEAGIVQTAQRFLHRP